MEICAWLNKNNLKNPPVGVHPHQVILMVGVSLHQKLETGNNHLQDPHQTTCLEGHLPILVNVEAPLEEVAEDSILEVEQEELGEDQDMEVIAETPVEVVEIHLGAEEVLGVLLV